MFSRPTNHSLFSLLAHNLSQNMSCHYSHGHSELSVLSLEEYRVPISPVVRDELVSQFTTLYNDDDKEKKAGNHVDQLLMAMKEAPYPTICRCVDPSQVRRVTKDLSKVLDKWKQRQQQLLLRTTTHNHNTKQPPMITVQTSPHSWMEDVICVTVATRSTTTTTTTTTEKNTTPIATTTTATTTTTTTEKNANAKEEDTTELLFANWPKRAECGWPLTHRVVVCDRYCGEAVLRGSDIFVRGILCADTHIQRGETVQVYAHVSTNNKPHRGLVLQRYQQGTCVHLGTGIAACDRAHMFSQSQGLGVEMLAVNNGTTTTRTTMYHPPLHGVLEQDMMLQNLASLTVARALNVHNDDDDLVILDMCAAPGGKTSHVASLALPHLPRIVACDKSRRKILAARDLFQRHGFANHITPLALDTTKCCFPSTSTTNNNNNYDDEGGRYETVDEVGWQQMGFKRDAFVGSHCCCCLGTRY